MMLGLDYRHHSEVMFFIAIKQGIILLNNVHTYVHTYNFTTYVRISRGYM